MKNLLILYGILLLCSPLWGQTNNFQPWSIQANLTSNQEAEKSQEFVEYKEDWKEIKTDRTLTSAFFKNSKGDIRAEYASKAIHYYDNGILKRIHSKLKKVSKGYVADQQPYPTYLNSDGSLSLSIDQNNNKLTIGKHASIFNQISDGQFDLQNNTAYYDSYFEGVDKQVVFSENKIKYAYRLNEYIESDESNFIISESIDIPSNCELVPMSNKSSTKDGLIFGSIAVINKNGNQVAEIRPLLCFDAQKKYTLGGYRIVNDRNGLQLQSYVPSSWLESEERIYPVIIDPEISGPAVEWNGGDMPSCLLPNYNSDSIQVTIPAGVTVSGFFITASFYASPFSPAVMSDGVMSFSTSCSVSQSFTITGANAELPGTAYLDSFDIKNPLVCCFPESCNDTSVYVTMNLARGDFGTGCNTSYVFYDDITDWPFRVVVYGKTPEVYGNEFYVSPSSICSNTCTFNATGYARYGVAPYTFTHPWTTEVVTIGENTGCGAGATNNVFTLTIPDCPVYCDENYTSLVIPPPVITDACGQSILNIPNNSKPVDPAPNVESDYEEVYCSGESIDIELSSCLEGGEVQYYGNNLNGFGSISLVAENNTQSSIDQTYYTYASLDDCFSDTTEINISVVPNPQAEIQFSSNPLVVNLDFEAADVSATYVNPVDSWNWILDGSEVSSDSLYLGSFATPGTYDICLNIMDEAGCTNLICETLLVVPAELQNINVITPNDDNINDELAFQYLEFYPENEIYIFNRWGNLLYYAESYDNSWSGDELNEGTYFYILKISGIDKTYSSFFLLKKD
ncbi:gliding motility-associated C-terminal domain-containing protein [Crocinitomicaceae bacterium]|nr:gliding motility-associated C-terminal domain-containing protein [Crocinitomicaceae bacterium]